MNQFRLCHMFRIWPLHLSLPNSTSIRQTLATIRYTSRPEPSQALPTEAHIIDIHYILSSVPKRIRYHPQYCDIYFMSREPSHPLHDIPSMSSPLEEKNTYPLTVPPAISQDPLYSLIFHWNEDILEELTNPDFPWNALHHQALFFSQEVFYLPDR
jgi:hypothetical protein